MAEPTNERRELADLVFGPVPSRRLGRSLGINNVTSKACTCACVYCQLGRTTAMQTARRPFFPPQKLVEQVQHRVERCRENGDEIDYLTFVPNGEPTLDLGLGQEIALLRPLCIPIAVITNANLIWRRDVRQDLLQADWVSLKVDAVTQDAWRAVDRPRRSLNLAEVLAGASEFAAQYRGHLVTETMLVRGVNDGSQCVQDTIDYIAALEPETAYLSVPIRPPAEEWVRAPAESALNRAYQIASSKLPRVEYLIGYEGNAFAATGDARQDLLSITAVHPMPARCGGRAAGS